MLSVGAHVLLCFCLTDTHAVLGNTSVLPFPGSASHGPTLLRNKEESVPVSAPPVVILKHIYLDF